MKAMISTSARKRWAMILAFVMIVSVIIPTTLLTAKAEVGKVTFNGTAAGWFESAYAEWALDNNADGYVAYVKEAGADDSAYTKVDNELLRKYSDHWRVDVVGLKAGSYVIKVVPVKDGQEVSAKATVTDVLNVEAYDRSGFAFSSKSLYKTGSGAYNDDGTLKSNAHVLYVTKDTAKTVTCDVIVDSKGTKQTFTGLQTILDARQKKYDKTPLDIRIIGSINRSDLDKISSSEEGIQIKGNAAYYEMNITIEGIGNDASVKGFGFLLRNCGNVEMRNFSILDFMDDGISIDTKNCNIWIHNVDLYYGQAGSDADQKKGDGSIDVKAASTNVTISYCHFYDAGKCSLCGMSDSAEFLVTYHHNWFDHSDSRHPRIRVASVHVYNNFFDGNSKYGVGVTKASSAFVENNYFNTCKYPMLMAGQGTDRETGDSGKGTFSGEDGGFIKAYGNVIVSPKKLVYANSDAGTLAADATQFDAYLAGSRDEKVPSSYVTAKGGTPYNNFDTSSSYDLGVTADKVDAAEDVPSIVKKNAGSLGGGVVAWTFTDSDNESDKVATELKSQVVAYELTTLKTVGGVKGSVIEQVTTAATQATTAATQATTAATQATTKADATTAANSSTEATQAPVAGAYVHNFTTDGKTSSVFTISGNINSTDGKVSYNGLTLTKRLKMETATSIKFTAPADGKLTLVFDADFVKGTKVNGTKLTAANGVITTDVKAGSVEITKGDSTNLFYISYVPNGTVAPTEATTAATQATTAAPTQATTAATEATTEAPTTGKTDAADVDKNNSYDKTSTAYTGAVTNYSTMKDSEFNNVKMVSTSEDILKAIKEAKAGDTIIIKEGTYKFDSDEEYLSKDEKGNVGGPALITKNNGTADAYIVLKAEEGKQVKFDFSSQKLLGSNRGLVADADYWYFEGINFYHAGDNGVLLSGNNNIFEKCVFEANRDTGLQIARFDTNKATKDLWPSNNLIINCTTFNNVDPVSEGGSGENADGFAAKLTCGEGNVFEGCISYNNSDDGWDLFAKSATGPIGKVTLRNCIAFNNGTLTTGETEKNADMNGFKLGGSGIGTAHSVFNCLAFNNGATGFTDNNNPSNIEIVNCTAVNNGGIQGKANFVCERAASGALYVNLLSVGNKSQADTFTGKMINSVIFNRDAKSYLLIGAGSVLQGGEAITKATAKNLGSKVADPVVNMNAMTINNKADINAQLRNADGTINTNGLYESADAALGAHFNIKTQMVTLPVAAKQAETPVEQPTEATTATTEAPTSAPTQAPTSAPTQAPTQAPTSAPTQAPTSAPTQAPTVAPTQAPVKTETLILNANNLAAQTYSAGAIENGFAIVAGSAKNADGKDAETITVDSNKKSINGESFTQRIKLNGTMAADGHRAIAFQAADNAELTVIAISGSSSATRALNIYDINGNVVAEINGIGGAALSSNTVKLPKAGVYFLGSPASGMNIVKLTLTNGVKLTAVPSIKVAEQPTEAPTQAPTSAPTQAPTSAPTQAPTQAPTSAPTQAPTAAPTQAPTAAPTQAPTVAPTQAATKAPEVAADEAVVEAPVVATEAEVVNAEVDATQQPTQPAKSGEVAANETKTGDNSNMMLYVIIFVLAAGVFGTTVVVAKKRRA